MLSSGSISARSLIYNKDTMLRLVPSYTGILEKPETKIRKIDKINRRITWYVIFKKISTKKIFSSTSISILWRLSTQGDEILKKLIWYKIQIIIHRTLNFGILSWKDLFHHPRRGAENVNRNLGYLLNDKSELKLP